MKIIFKLFLIFALSIALINAQKSGGKGKRRYGYGDGHFGGGHLPASWIKRSYSRQRGG